MKPVFRIEKVMIHSENMNLTAIKTRVKIFGKEILTYKHNTSKNQFKNA